MGTEPGDKHSKRIPGNSRVTVHMAWGNRRAMTEAESLLWAALRGNQLDGLRFRAQHPVGQFILDFYCSRCKLGVDVDGEVHAANRVQDLARTEHIESYGYRVIRFTNDQVLTDLPSVLAAIRQASNDQVTTLATRNP